jgi:hypothetical protein
MKNRWAFASAALLACVPVLTGCGGGSDGRNDERPANANTSVPQPAAAATIALSGCLEAAPGTNQYALRNVRWEPRSVGDPHAATTTPGAHGITEGAWVRVDGGDSNLNNYLGQRVVLKGTVMDSGRNTIGTAGAPGAASPTGDTSQAASSEHHSDKQKKEMGRIARESMANGTAAEVRAQEVAGTGDRCVPPQQ